MRIWIKGGLIGAGLLFVMGTILFLLINTCYNTNGAICHGAYSPQSETEQYETGACLYAHFQNCRIYSAPFSYMYEFPAFLVMDSDNINYSSLSNGLTGLIIFSDVAITGFVIGAIIGFVVPKIIRKRKR